MYEQEESTIRLSLPEVWLQVTQLAFSPKSMEAVLAKGFSLTNLLGGNLLKQDDVILSRHSLGFLVGGADQTLT